MGNQEDWQREMLRKLDRIIDLLSPPATTVRVTGSYQCALCKVSVPFGQPHYCTTMPPPAATSPNTCAAPS